jgi:UDP-2,4-diacetamido-2,4,6-trideoxy-beta-L-altropyranose hydrolase
MKQLIIRADASASVGTGHVMRCLALAQAWAQQGGSVHFVSQCDASAIRERVDREGFAFHAVDNSNAGWTAVERLAADQASVLVLDGYTFTAADHAAGRRLGVPVMAVDDNAHLPRYAADIILNQNLCAPELHYSAPPETRLLLGTEYALIRREFIDCTVPDRSARSAGRLNLLVTLGGGDPDNVTLKVVEACKRTPDCEVIVVAGGANRNLLSLQTAVAGHSHIQVRSAVFEMPALMAWADFAVTAAGSGCWEACYMGLPAITIVMAANQERNAHALAEANVTFNLGWHTSVSMEHIASAIDALAQASARRSTMTQRGPALVDGKGAARVTRILRQFAMKAAGATT